MKKENWEQNGADRETMRIALNKLSQSMQAPDPVPYKERLKIKSSKKPKKEIHL